MRPSLNRAGWGEGAEDINYVEMPDGMDWLLRPAVCGMCRYESLKDGTLDLADIALMNDVLDVKAENETRYLNHHKNKK